MFLTCALALLPQTTMFGPPPERPRDPWVFRSVLDGHARMVTLALSDEMWVAYDAATCRLYKAWKGGVQFAGAVYTNEHGPQPTSTGPAYGTEDMWGMAWQAEVGGRSVDSKVTWRGYELAAGRAVLHYEVLLPDGRVVAVRETPESAWLSEAAGAVAGAEPPCVALERRFEAEGLGADTRLALRVRIEAGTSLLSEALVRVELAAAIEGEPGQLTRMVQVELSADRPRAGLVLCFPPLKESTSSAAPVKSPGEVRR